MQRIKLNLIAEIKANDVMVARRILDAFREAALPSENYGISLYENYQVDRNECRCSCGRECGCRCHDEAHSLLKRCGVEVATDAKTGKPDYCTLPNGHGGAHELTLSVNSGQCPDADIDDRPQGPRRVCPNCGTEWDCGLECPTC